jgi:hypothetical protein
MTERSIGSLAAEITNRLAEQTGRQRPFGVEQHPVTDRGEWLRWRRQDITASGAAALLGAHPFVTAYGLWAEKTDALPADNEMTEAMERGIELEPIAVKRLAKLQPTWRVEQPNTYYRDPGARLGATPDCFAHDPARDGFGVVQVKSVEPSVFRRTWRSHDGNIEPPLWIVCQAIIEAHLTGASWVAVAALVISYGIELHVVEVPLHAGIIERIKSETAAFWQMVESGQRPEPDWKRDSRLLEALYNPTGEVVDLTTLNHLPELADEKERLSAQNRVNDLRLKEIKNEFLARLGDASAARIADGRLIMARRVAREAYSVKASSYVQVQVKKEAAL